MMIDENSRMPGDNCKCYDCKHNTNHGVCKAFDYIPDDIWYGKVSHDKPYPGDNGILFEPIEEKN